MRKLVKSQTLLMLAVSCAAGAGGCRSDGKAPDEISVKELARLLSTDVPPKVYDANGTSTRHEYGIIPGAILLPSSSDYDLDILPAEKDRSLVFYCASSWCGAADNAAERAIHAGYRAVSVLPEGIKGWKQAGMATENLRN